MTMRTVDGVISGMRFTRQGQSCTAGSRLFLHRSIFESFLGKLAARLEQLRIGDPLDEATDMGAIINRKQFDRVCEYIEDGLSQQEGRVVLGGLPPATGPLAEGYFVQPTVFADVRNDWRIAREEIFGPVMVAIPWDDRGRRHPHGQRLALRSCRICLDARHRNGADDRPCDRIRAGFRSTRASVNLQDIPTAASSRAGSAANTPSKACWTASRSARA